MTHCSSTFVVDAGQTLKCEIAAEDHRLRNPFIPRFGNYHEAHAYKALWFWDDEEARLSKVKS